MHVYRMTTVIFTRQDDPGLDWPDAHGSLLDPDRLTVRFDDSQAGDALYSIAVTGWNARGKDRRRRGRAYTLLTEVPDLAWIKQAFDEAAAGHTAGEPLPNWIMYRWEDEA
jgi:hypothetical protein